MNRYIQRDIFPELSGHIFKQEMTIITGARQTGKTVLLTQLRDWLTETHNVIPEKILFFNLDIVKDWEFFQDQAKFIEYVKDQSSQGKVYLFIDEAQKVPDCARFFKGVYDSDLNAKLVLTGSASFELKGKLKESLSGRKRIFSVFPFSFHEYLLTVEKELADYLDKDTVPSLITKKLLNCYQKYMVWGGYPRVVLSNGEKEKTAVLAEIYSSYIEKDIVALLEIKNKLGFSRLLKLLVHQTGQLINIAELANSANLDRETVERYIYALEETYIIKTLPPYFKNRRQEIVKQNKVYAIDLGLRNYLVEDFSSFDERMDAGFIVENSCFKEILLSLGFLWRLRFWRTKVGAEVDFVVIKSEDLFPIEIKARIKKPSISVGMRNFIDKYSPSHAAMVSLSLSGEKMKVGKTDVHFIHPFEYAKLRRNYT